MKHLKDPFFLELFDQEKIRAQFVSIVILNFQEQPIREIQGTISAGSISVNGGSAVRRTLSLTMQATEDTNKLTNINNIISINKKIKVAVGYKNYFADYKDYGDIIWFPCGMYVVEKASLSRNTTGYSISINGKDKMALLDGTIGGKLPASVTFHERYEIDEEENITVSKPTIYQIIQEAVNHYGGEPINNIEINDLDQTAKMLVRWQGDYPMWLDENSNNIFIASDSEQLPPNPNGTAAWVKYTKGMDVGYLETPMTYPGQLILNAGETVTSLLDKINTTLGKIYEYFYDLNGKFVFQKIKDYTTESYTPLTSLEGKMYSKSFNESKYQYSFNNTNTIVSVNYNPAYDKIKNDFIVWGSRELASGAKLGIRYHLAIDEKPELDLCTQYMWAMIQENRVASYVFSDTNVSWYTNDNGYRFIGPPVDEWREELYRRALLAQVDASAVASNYDAELIAEWRKLYDPTGEWAKQPGERKNWNPSVFDNPAILDYWLDFIDTGSQMGEYAVNKIGRRSEIQKNDNIRMLYTKPVPDIIFINNTDPERNEKVALYQMNGQRFCQVTPEQMEFFSISSTGISAFDQIREILYQHLTYNISASITCIPRFYFEPNTLIYIQDKESGVEGNFIMKQFTLPLTYNGTMSITANEALTRI